jgi:hypothetical protein
MVIAPALKDVFRERLWPYLWQAKNIRAKQNETMHKFLLAEISEDVPWCVHSPEVMHHVRRLEVLYDIVHLKEAMERQKFSPLSLVVTNEEVALVIGGVVHVSNV